MFVGNWFAIEIMKTIITTIKRLVNLLTFMLLSILLSGNAGASSCVDLGPASDRPVAVRMATSDNLIAIGFPNDGKVMVFELTDRNELKLRHVVVPPDGSLFSSNHKGFGHSVAVTGDRVVIGAYRMETSVPQERDKALEYPKNVFTTSEVFLFDLRHGGIEKLVNGDREQATGFSVAAVGDTVAWSVFEKPPVSEYVMSVFHAASGSIMIRNLNNNKTHQLRGPADVRGFGFALAGAPDGYLILAPFGKRSEVFRVSLSGSASGVSSVTELNSSLFANLAATQSFLVISTGKLLSTDEAATIVLPNKGEPLSFAHGGSLSASENFLAIVQPAMHEGGPVPLLYLCKKLSNGEMKLVKVKKGVIGAAVMGDSVVTVSKGFSGALRLCVE